MNRSELQAMAQRELERQRKFRCRLLCCASTPCLSSGSSAVQAELQKIINADALDAEVETVSTGCMGPCSRGPLVILQMDGEKDVVYQRVTPEQARRILDKHVRDNTTNSLDEHILPPDWPFFTKQTKIVLANSGLMDPERLEDYVARWVSA